MKGGKLAPGFHLVLAHACALAMSLQCKRSRYTAWKRPRHMQSLCPASTLAHALVGVLAVCKIKMLENYFPASVHAPQSLLILMLDAWHK